MSQTTLIALFAVLGIAAYLVGRYVLHVSCGQCRWLLVTVFVAGGTLFALVVAGFGWILGGTPTRFLAVLVIATPCPLLLAISVAIIGAISLAASPAIIIKDPSMLERIDTCRTFILDKTGALTYGRPALTDVICAPGNTREQVVRMTAAWNSFRGILSPPQ